MDGKIPVLSRLLIISLLFVLSGNAYSDRDYSPGDVIFISLNQSESLVDFYYKGNLITKVLKDKTGPKSFQVKSFGSFYEPNLSIFPFPIIFFNVKLGKKISLN